jgi:hypothetical protein
MRDLIVENKIGLHFNLKKIIEDSSINLEFLNNDLVVLSNGDSIIFGFTLSDSIVNKRKKTGFDGYGNIIKLCLYKILKNQFGGIAKKSISVKIRDKTKNVKGESVKYVYVKVLITKSIEVQLLKNLPNYLDDLKKYIHLFLSDDNPYAYRYI